jgi:cyclic 2,3-diphosphoglycerate synthase
VPRCIHRGRVPGEHVTERAVAIVDGEHYPSVVKDALAELPYEVVCAVLVGGKEKLRGDGDYGVEVLRDVGKALERFHPDLVVDLSDEPVLGPVERLRLASEVLARRLPYVGADFRFDPPDAMPFPLPSLAVMGTGKRVGKTAVTGHLARLLSSRMDVVVVAMGRGGPAEPEVVTIRPTVDALVALSRAGRHAASDHLETAALTGVTTVGCRRCGGGLAGAVFASNVAAGARVAVELDPGVVIFDGSGAALPPVETDRRLLVVGGNQAAAVAAGYLNTYRILCADLVILTFAGDAAGWEAVLDAVRAVARPGVEVMPVVLRPRPLSDVAGRSVAYFCTAPEAAHALLSRHLEEVHGARIVHVSGNLADRDELRQELPRVEADVYLVELKAAAIDVVAEQALERGGEVVLAANDVVSRSPERGLDEMLLEMAGLAV